MCHERVPAWLLVQHAPSSAPFPGEGASLRTLQAHVQPLSSRVPEASKGRDTVRGHRQGQRHRQRQGEGKRAARGKSHRPRGPARGPRTQARTRSRHRHGPRHRHGHRRRCRHARLEIAKESRYLVPRVVADRGPAGAGRSDREGRPEARAPRGTATDTGAGSQISAAEGVPPMARRRCRCLPFRPRSRETREPSRATREPWRHSVAPEPHSSFILGWSGPTRWAT